MGKILAAAAMALAGLAAQAGELRLLMVERAGCEWCEVWDRDIAPVYPRTPEGAQAPLSRVQLSDAPPEGVRFARPARFTPTFILLEDDREIDRIEGYPGEDFFWGLLSRMIERATGAEGGKS